MPISRTSAALVAGLMVLAGCDPAGVSGASATRATVNAGGQSITIAAPAGFCVDRRSTSVTSSGAFVLISDCALLGGPSISGAAPVGAAMTASVSTGGLGDGGPATRSLADLALYAETQGGKALVGRSGQAAGVRILNSQTKGDVLYMLVEDRGSQQIAGIDPRFWRGFLEVNGRLVALSQLSFQGGGVDTQEGLNLIAAYAGAIQRANPATAPAPPAAAAPAAQ